MWPESSLNDLPKTHPIYTHFRELDQNPKLMGMALARGQGRLGVIYIPHGFSCIWEVGGKKAAKWLDVGACIYLYVDKISSRLRPEPIPDGRTVRPRRRVDEFGEDFGDDEE